MARCLLEVPTNESCVTLVDESGRLIFKGDDLQANRVQNIIPPIAGGSTHRIYLEGDFEVHGKSIIVEVRDGLDLGSSVQFEMVGNVIKRISVYWL